MGKEMTENDSSFTRTAKQVIVIRKDLNMRKGKMVAQGAHASLACVLNIMRRSEGNLWYTFILKIKKTSALFSWLTGSFTKICVSVNSEEELKAIHLKAVERGLLCSLIVDAGNTEFHGVPTTTCCAILGWSDEIDGITGELPLL